MSCHHFWRESEGSKLNIYLEIVIIYQTKVIKLAEVCILVSSQSKIISSLGEVQYHCECKFKFKVG